MNMDRANFELTKYMHTFDRNLSWQKKNRSGGSSLTPVEMFKSGIQEPIWMHKLKVKLYIHTKISCKYIKRIGQTVSVWKLVYTHIYMCIELYLKNIGSELSNEHQPRIFFTMRLKFICMYLSAPMCVWLCMYMCAKRSKITTASMFCKIGITCTQRSVTYLYNSIRNFHVCL